MALRLPREASAGISVRRAQWRCFVKSSPRSPRAFLQAQSLVLGWGGDARVSGKAEDVVREGKPRLLPPQPGFPLAVVS